MMKYYKNYLLYIITISMIFLSACVQLKGKFACKSQLDDHYRKMDANHEIKSDEKINWVYVFDKFSGKHKIGVIILKKEIVWIDVLSWHDEVTPSENIIYGTIEDFQDGKYKIILTENDKEFDEQRFIVYSD